jgi:shikimate kinase|tara:strand:- start:89 stop:598 length:510 start_codon:yes stop_codon:yes gene_type:complete
LKKNLTLTGMMGVGKSTVGKSLSNRLSLQFIDVDKIIEKKLNMKIQNIFKKKGEIFFRELEEKITLQEIKKEGIVISLGGGAFINPKIRKEILATSKSFWLDMNISLIEKRLVNSKKRPLLDPANLKNDLKEIYNERKKIYALANYRIDCDKLNINLITNKIISLYDNY